MLQRNYTNFKFTFFWNFLKKQRITKKYDKLAVRLRSAQANDKSGQGSKVMMMTFLIVAPEILRMSGPSADQQANNFQPGLQAAPDTNTTRTTPPRANTSL